MIQQISELYRETGEKQKTHGVNIEAGLAVNNCLGCMSTLTEREIDKLVIAQADDDNPWEKPILVNRKRIFSIASARPAEIASEKDVMSGEPVFRGTRVPVSAMFDNLEAGMSVDEFVEKFPAVTRDQAVQVLEYFKRSLTQLKEAV